MLETPTGRAGFPTQQPSTFPTTPAGGGPKDPGEFTRMLNSPFAAEGLAGQPLAAPAPRQAATGEATRAFQRQEAPPGAPVQQGPSEFTKMFQAPAPAPAPAAPKPVKKAAMRPPIAKKKTNWVLWVLVGLALVMILVLLFHFVFK